MSDQAQLALSPSRAVDFEQCPLPYRFRAIDRLFDRLRSIYLADGQILDYTPDLDELMRFENTMTAIWRAIGSAGATGDFPPNRTWMCQWCSHQSLCPAFAAHHRPIHIRAGRND